jgi:hypothetical protein
LIRERKTKREKRLFSAQKDTKTETDRKTEV